MRIPSWLRQTVADFFRVDSDEEDTEAECAQRELDEARSLTLLALTQVRRTELELRDALAAAEPDPKRLAELVPRLEEERRRADNLVADYRRREEKIAAQMTRLGNVRVAEELNRRREELREAMVSGHEERLAQMEDDARADAFRLDVLDRLDTGEGWSRESTACPRPGAAGRGAARRAVRRTKLGGARSHGRKEV